MRRRVERVSELIKREVAMIVAREVRVKDVLLTITRIEISLDLQYGTVYFTTIPAGAAQSALERLEKHVAAIQQILNRRLRMRPVPKIRFTIDEGEQEAAHIDELLERI